MQSFGGGTHHQFSYFGSVHTIKEWQRVAALNHCYGAPFSPHASSALSGLLCSSYKRRGTGWAFHLDIIAISGTQILILSLNAGVDRLGCALPSTITRPWKRGGVAGHAACQSYIVQSDSQDITVKHSGPTLTNLGHVMAQDAPLLCTVPFYIGLTCDTEVLL